MLRRIITSDLVITLAAFAGCSAVHAQDAADHATSAQVATERDAPPAQRSARAAIEIAAPTPSPAPSPGREIFVGAITIQGLIVLSPADFADIIAENIGRMLGPEDLARLVNAASERVRSRGYPLGLARIDAQRVANGILVVQVDEGQIDEIRLEGPDNRSVREALAPLRNGRPIRIKEIERRLLIAGDISGVQIKGSRFFREGDRRVLLVRTGFDRVSGYASVSNQGTRPIGREQARIELNFNGLLEADDSLTLGYTSAIVRPRELQSGYLRYEKRLNSSGTETALTASGSITHPGAYLDPYNIENRSWYVGASVRQPLLRRRSESFWLQAEIGIRNLSQSRAGIRTRRDQLTVGRLSLYGYKAVLGGRMRFGATVSEGLGIFGATETGDTLASRRNADGTFTAFNAWTDWTRNLSDEVSVRLAAAGQLASQLLPVSEVVSLGGTSFLRGYDWGERTGDDGVMSLAELRYAWMQPAKSVERAQLYAFVDGGAVSNKDDSFGSGSLASTGGGIRVDFTSRFGMNLEVAVPLSGPRYDTGDNQLKVNFGIAQSF